MAKINRATQKIFGSNANSTAITEFGTAKNAEPTYITDGNVEDIQANPSFLTGWSNSLEQDLAPFMQDSNALWYMITSQVAYLLKNGIAEYDAGTSYDLGDLAKVVQQNGTVVVYKSLQNDNLNNSTGDSNYWVMYSADDNLAKYEIGLPQPSLTNNKLANEIWLDGTMGTPISGTDSTLVNIANYPLLFAAYGTKYGGNGTTTFGLPNFTGKSLWGVSSFGTGYLGATLPNIKGSVPASEDVYKGSFNPPAYGAFYKYSSNVVSGQSVNDKFDNDFWSFDANRYNPIYQDGATVRPPSIEVRWKTRWY